MKIFDWLYYFKQKYKDSKIDDQINPVRTTQENPRDAQAVKEFNKSFEAQQVQSRSMAAHEKDCPMINCGGCFKRVADKIVGKPKIVSCESVREDMKKRVRSKKSEPKGY